MVSKRLGLADVNATREQVESLTKHPREGDSEPSRMGIVEPDTREHGLQPYIVPSRVGGSSYRRRTLWLRQKNATSWLTQDSACAYLSGARQIGATDNLLPKTQKVC
jgi:hypothetical protein